MVVKNCEEVEGGLPKRLHTMMMINVIIDFIIGLVPFIGDLADAVYKCNTRNAVILEKHLREKGAKSVKSQPRDGPQAGQQHPRVQEIQDDVDHSLPEEWDKQETGVVDNAPPMYEESGSSNGGQAGMTGAHPTRPPPTKQSRGNRSFGRWFGGPSHQEDLERGA